MQNIGSICAENTEVDGFFLGYREGQIMLFLGEASYFWPCTDSVAADKSDEFEKTIEAKKWYNNDDGTLYEPEESPINDTTFNKVYSETYLNRVINSFNK